MQIRKEVVGDLGEQKVYEDQETGLSIVENDFFGPTVYLLEDADVALAGINVTFAADGSVLLSLNSMVFEPDWEKWVANAERVVKTIRAYKAEKAKEQQ